MRPGSLVSFGYHHSEDHPTQLKRPSNTDPSVPPGRYGEDERWRLVEEILLSRTFAKAARLSSFLRYICEQTLDGKADRINEQLIGVHVFSRSPAYVATDDSIVRSQARLLRQKLAEYFEHERPGSPLILSIPKGGYVPVFQRNTQMEQRREAVDPPLETPPPDTHALAAIAPVRTVESSAQEPHRRRPWIVWLIASVLLGLLGWDIALHLVSVPHSTGPQQMVWSAIFKKDRQTLIVSSDDGLVLLQELTKTPVSLDDYLSGTYLEKMPLPKDPMPLSASWLNAHQYTSMADLSLAMRLARVPEGMRERPQVRYARDVRMDDLKDTNVILIGGIGANPWVGLFENQLNFAIDYDWKASRGYVGNKSPRNGEQPRYEETGPDKVRHNYGVLAFLRGVSGQGDALLFEGTGMAGTESAADFLFNEESFGAFARQIGSTRGRMPHFEVLLETANVGGNAPQERVVAYRVLDQ